MTANADLALNTLSHFLDRFVYRNPKKPKAKGASAMQPSASINANDGTSVRLVKGSHADELGNVNDAEFWKKNVKDVPADQVFFHKYFSQKQEQEKAKKSKVARRKKGNVDEEGDEDVPDDDEEEEEEEIEEEQEQENDDDEEASTDEEEEDEIWKVCNKSRHTNITDNKIRRR